MAGHVAATLTYVRTTDGVVKVAAGEAVPAGALPEELARLASAGAIEAASAAEPVEKPKPASKGKSGT